MTVSIKRFDILDGETDLPVSDFLTSDNTSILNSVNNSLIEVTEEVETFLENAKQTLDIGNISLPDVNLDVIKDFIPDGIDFRKTKDMLSNAYDSKSLSLKDADKLIKSLMSDNPLAAAGILQMPSDCKNNALGNSPAGKSFGKEVDCNGNKKSANGDCSTKNFGESIGKLTGGTFNFDFSDLDSLLNTLTSLSSMGYDLNLCGIFSAISSGITDSNLLSRASASVLGGLVSKSDVLGMLDLASSSVGLHTKLEFPDVASKMLKSFNLPTSMSEIDLVSLTGRFEGAMEIFDNTWKASGLDGMLSSQGVKSEELSTLYTGSVMENVFDSSLLDVAPISDDVFLLAAYT